MWTRTLATIGLLLLPASTALAEGAGDAAVCDRACLERHARDYLDATIQHAPAKAHLVADVKYTENQVRADVGKGIWLNARAIGPYQMFIADIRSHQIVFMGNIQTDAGWSMIAIRLKVSGASITEAEAIIPGVAASDGTFDLGAGASQLTTARAAFATPLLSSERRDRSQIIQAADLHYEGIERGNGDIVPFGDKCIKVENGMQLILNPNFPTPVRSPTGAKLPNYQAMGCQQQFNTHVWDTDTITDRRYPVVDEERGIVVAFGMYNQYIKGPCANVVDYGPACPSRPVTPYSLAMAEAFKVRGGLIEEVEAVFTVLPALRTRGVW